MATWIENGYDEFLTINNLKPSLEDGITNANSDAIIGGGAVGFDQTTINMLYPNQDVQSQNFVSGTTGWKLFGDGNIEAVGLTLTGGTIKYNKTSFIDSVNAGYFLSSLGLYIGSASDVSYLKYTIGDASFDVKAKLITNAGSEIDGQYLLDNSVASASANLSLRGWTFTSLFSSTDYDTVAWTTGTFTASDGTAYSISSGNTGNISALTYIYLDITVSTTILQTTTTAVTAVGNGKVLIAIAKNNSDTTSDATLQVFGGSGGQTLLVDNIAANSVSTNEFVSNTAQIANLVVTNAKINDLAVSKLTTGSILSKQITLAVTGGTGDSFIAGGKTDFTNTESGFILGVDDSDSDKAKFYIGNSTNYLNWDATNLVATNMKTVKTFTAGESISTGQSVIIGDGSVYVVYDGSGNTASSVGGSWLAAQLFTTSTTAIYITGITGTWSDNRGNGSLDYTVYLYASSDGKPTGSVLATATVNHTNYNQFTETLTFSSPYACSANTAYCAVASSGGMGGMLLKANTGTGGSEFISGAWNSTGIYAYPKCLSVNEINTIAGNIYLSNASRNWVRSNNFIGLASETKTSGNTCGVYITDVATGLSGLIIGVPYYLDNTSGAISSTPGTVNKKIGLSLSTTELLILNI